MAVFGGSDSTFSASDYADVGTPAASSGGVPSFLSDPFYGGDGSGAMPGVGSPSTPATGGLGTALGSDLSSIFTGSAIAPYLGGAAAPAAAGPGTSLALFGACTTKGTHLNKTAYYRKVMGIPVRIPKHSVCVKNRRRNAGNGRAVVRALGRVAMFDHLARRVESEMARVARRHHRPARAACAPRSARGHRTGCKCFACRR